MEVILGLAGMGVTMYCIGGGVAFISRLFGKDVDV